MPIRASRPESPREGQYDVRVGASHYAPIISVFGSLAVPTVIVVLQDVAFKGNTAEEELTLALLIIGILGSLGSGFGFAAIAAERDPTANLIPAVMFLAVPASVGLGSVFAAFGVVASLHLPDVSVLFSVLLALLGCFGVFFTAFTVTDAAGVGPRLRRRDGSYTDEVDPTWLASQWITDRDGTWSKTWPLLLIGFGIIAVGFVVRLWSRWHIEPSFSWTVAVVVILGLASLVAIALTSRRTFHPRRQVGLRPWEAHVTVASIAVLIVLLLFIVP